MIKKKIKEKTNNFFIPNILIVLLAGLIVRVFLANFGTLKLDQNTFIAWSNILVERGFSNFYSVWSDYLPGYLYVLWFLGKIKSIIVVPDVFLYKFPAILSDLLTGFLIYKIVARIKNEKLGLISAGIYIFNPAIWANSTLWGQVDSLTSLSSLLAIYFLTSNPFLSSLSLALGTLIKPQVAFLLPVIIYLMFKNKWDIKKIVSYGFFGLSIFVLGFIPFLSGKNLIGFIFERILATSGQYPYTSINAFNFWGIFGFWKPDSGFFPPILTGLFFIIVVALVSFKKLWKRDKSEYLLASLMFGLTFIFLTRMHERHLLSLFAPLTIASAINPYLWIPYLGFSITYLANLFYSYNWVSNDFLEVFSGPVVKIFSIFNLLYLFLVFQEAFRKRIEDGPLLSIKELVNKFFKKEKLLGSTRAISFPQVKLTDKKVKIILSGILLFSFIARIAWLWEPSNEYFDEVYHAFTARQILHNNPKAWEWWNTPPSGFAYEWTHPPLAKLGMVIGMTIFGENAFGWRIAQAMLGVGVVYLIYLLSKELFKDELVALLSAGIFSLDGLALVMSRIGMNDTYFLFFILLSIYLFLKNKDFSSSTSFGLALASKWSALWAIPIFGVIWLLRKRDFKISYLWFLIVPPLVYLASYVPMFLTGHSLEIFWGMQKQMWWYHTGLRATHPYTSSWWSWPLLLRPIYLYTSSEIGGMVSRIYAFGNPAIFWFGLLSIFLSLIYIVLERNKSLALVVFSYLIFFVPWAASPRIMFLYHYLPSIPFMAISSGYLLRKNPKYILPFFIIALVIFIYFYPHWAGLKIPLGLDKSYYWFSSWR